jgi:hypothetical protein
MTKAISAHPRRQHARMTVAPANIEAAIEADRRFFARHPERHFYIRRVHPAEREQAARAGQPLAPPPSGMVDLVAVEQVRRGARLRVFGIAADGDIDTDQVSEGKCRELFFAKASQRMLDLRAELLLLDN